MWSSAIKYGIDEREDPFLRAMHRDLEESPDPESHAETYNRLKRQRSKASTQFMGMVYGALMLAPFYVYLKYLNIIDEINYTTVVMDPVNYTEYPEHPLIILIFIFVALSYLMFSYTMLSYNIQINRKSLEGAVATLRMVHDENRKSRRKGSIPISPTDTHSFLFKLLNSHYARIRDVKHPHLRELMHTTLVEYAMIQSTREPSLFRIEPVRSLHENIMRDDLDFDPKILEGFDFLKHRTNNWSNFPAWAFEKAQAQTPTP